MVNYGSGAFGVSQRAFLVGSLLGAIPGQVSLVAIGAFIAEPGVGNGVVVAVAWIVVAVLTFFAFRELHRTRKASNAAKASGAAHTASATPATSTAQTGSATPTADVEHPEQPER